MIDQMAKPTEVSTKRTRRRFAVSEKLRILAEADACEGVSGALGALLRREAIYSSHLVSWRLQRDSGQFGDSPKKRGPTATVPDPRDRRIAELEKRLQRADARGDRYERLCALQKKASELLGIVLQDVQSEEKD